MFVFNVVCALQLKSLTLHSCVPASSTYVPLNARLIVISMVCWCRVTWSGSLVILWVATEAFQLVGKRGGGCQCVGLFMQASLAGSIQIVTAQP